MKRWTLAAPALLAIPLFSCGSSGPSYLGKNGTSGPVRKTAGTRTGRSPGDLTLKLQVIRAGDKFSYCSSKELELQAATQSFSNYVKLSLVLRSLPSGEDVVMVKEEQWGKIWSISVAKRGGAWYRLGGGPGEADTAFSVHGGPNFYRFRSGSNSKKTVNVHVREGRDVSGFQDTFYTVTLDGSSLRASHRELAWLRAKAIVAGAEEAKHYRAVADSEGYPYIVTNYPTRQAGVAFWSPFVFEPDHWRRITADPNFDPRTLRPVATVLQESPREGSRSSPVDFARVRSRVYGVGGPGDVFYIIQRNRVDMLEGGHNWENRRRALDHMKQAQELERKSRYADAVVEYGRAIALEPRMAQAYFKRACAAAGGEWSLTRGYAGNLSKAALRKIVADLTKAIELDPATYRVGSYFARGSCKLELGDLAGAEADITVAIGREPQHTYFYQKRKAVREKAGNKSGAAEDAATIARIEGEEKRKAEERTRRERYETPRRILVDGGVAKWSYATSSYTTLYPRYERKQKLLERRLKDINEKPILIQLVGNKAEYGGYYLKQLGFKLLKGKKVETEQRIQIVIESSSDYSAVLKTGQGRTIQEISGKGAMERAYNHVLLLYLKGKMEWQSDKYVELAEAWDTAEKKAEEKDYRGALEALGQLEGLDPEDLSIGKRRMEMLQALQDWDGVVAECVKQLKKAPEKEREALVQLRLQANEKRKDLAGMIEDLAWLEANAKSEYTRSYSLSRRAGLLAQTKRFAEAARAWEAYIRGKAPSASNYYTLADYRGKAGDRAGAEAARAKGLELSREVSADRALVEAGIATWKEREAKAVLLERFRAVFDVVGRRLRDPEEPRVRIHYAGPPEHAKRLEARGFEVREDSPAGCAVRFQIKGKSGALADARLYLPDGAELMTIRATYDWYLADNAAYAIQALAAAGRLSLLTARYREMVSLHAALEAARRGFDEAREIELLRDAAAKFPSVFDVQKEYWEALRRYGEYERLLEAAAPILERPSEWREKYRKTAKKDPWEEALNFMISAYSSLGRNADLLAAYDRLIRIVPEKRVSFMEYQISHLRGRGEFREAADRKEKVIEAKGKKADYSDYLEHGDLLKLAGDEAGARDAWRRASGLVLSGAWTYSYRASRRAGHGDVPGAIEDMNRAVELSAKSPNPDYHIRRAGYRATQGDVDGALEDYAAAIKIRPTSEVYEARAAFYEKLGEKKAAETDYKRAWTLPLSYAWYYHTRALRRAARGDKAGAIADLAKAAALDSGYLLQRARFVKHILHDDTAAEEDLGKALDAARDDARRAIVLDERARWKELRGDLEGAASDLGRAIKSVPTWERLLRRALLYRELGKEVRAELDVKRALGVPWNPNSYAARARDLLEWKKDQEAWDAYERALESLAPKKRARILADRAALKRRIGDLAGALRDWEAAIRLEPTRSHLLGRAELYRRMGKAAEAGEDVKRALELPWKAKEYGTLASALFSLGEIASVGEVHERALRDLPEKERPAVLVSRADFKRRADDLEGAEKDLNDAVAKQDSFDKRLLRALVRLRRGDTKGAEEDRKTAAAEKVTGYDLARRAQGRLAVGDAEGALEDARAYVALYPAYSYGYSLVAHILLELNRPGEALEAAERALAIADDTAASRVRAMVWATQGKKREALAAVGRPRSTSEWVTRGEVLLLLGDKEGARKSVERALAFGYSVPKAYLVLARVHLAREDRGAAAEAVRRGLALRPSDERERRELARLAKEATPR